MLKIADFLFNTNVDLQASPTTFSCCNIISHKWWSGLWMKSCLMLNWLKFHHIIHDTTAYTYQQVTMYSQKNDILGVWLIAFCTLATTLARQMWRHNDVIGRNEYLIYTLSESTFPWVYSLQFLFKSTHHSWRYERKCEWVFFSEHSVYKLYDVIHNWHHKARINYP